MDVGSYEHCDPHGRGEIEQRTTAGTKHMEVQVSRKGRKPVGTAGGRATQETKPRSNCREQRRKHDYKDVGVRVVPGATIELPRTPKRLEENQ